jgi:hypothetical protein
VLKVPHLNAWRRLLVQQMGHGNRAVLQSFSDPGNTAKFAGPDANGSLFDPVTLAPKIPGAYQAAFEVIQAFLGR